MKKWWIFLLSINKCRQTEAVQWENKQDEYAASFIHLEAGPPTSAPTLKKMIGWLTCQGVVACRRGGAWENRIEVFCDKAENLF